MQLSLCKLVDAYLMSHRISGLPRDIVSHVAAKVSRGISCLVLCGVGGHDPALQIMAPKGVAVEPVLTSLRAFHGAHGNWPRRKDVRAGGDALARKAAAAAKAWAGMSPSEQEKLRRDFTAEIEWLVRKPPLGVGGQQYSGGLLTIIVYSLHIDAFPYPFSQLILHGCSRYPWHPVHTIPWMMCHYA